jgi:altronate dehydratase
MNIIDQKQTQNRVIDAIKANGCDLTTVSNANDQRPVPAGAVIGAIKDLARDALAATAVYIGAKVEKNEHHLGMTIPAMDAMKEFEAEIIKNEQMAKKTLESIRSLKSSMALEMQLLEKVIKQIKRLDIGKTIEDLDRLKTLTESATIKKLFGGAE